MNDQPPIEIVLKVDIKDLRDIYFGNRDHVYFFGPNTKAVSFCLVSALIVCPLIAWYSIDIKEGGLFIFAIMLLLIGIIPFWGAAKPIIQWKKSVNEFLAMAEKVKELRVIYTDEYLLHFQDSNETKLDWTDIHEVLITDRYISLDPIDMLLPKSCMKPEEYALLCDKIMEKVPGVRKI